MMTGKHSGTLQAALGLLRPLWPIALLAAGMGSISGLATAGLLATINDALHVEGGALGRGLAAFAGLCLVVVTGEIASDIGTNVVGQRIIARLRQDLCEKILAAPVGRIEQYRTHRLMAALHADVDTISNFSLLFSPLAIAIAVTIGCLGYLALLSPAMFPIALVVIAIGIAAQILARRYGMERFARARDAEDELQRHYRAITEGAKELRINRIRRGRVADQLRGVVERIRDLRLQAVLVYCSANAFGATLFFVVIGLVLMVQQAAQSSDRSVLTGFALVLLYMKGPVQQVVSALPAIGRAQVALRRIAELSAQFKNPEPHLAIDGRPIESLAVKTIALKNARHVFPAAPGAEPFELGPINLTIERGEIVFIVGENGCGKTTLIKLLTGLYEPQQGELLLNGKAVTSDWRDDYRQLFSAVFFDYHLFEEVLFADNAMPAEIDAYLARLDIGHKVSICEGAFSTTDLSAGQRKRLALIQVCLEGRPILVFDEWAAEQDPTFRRIFYTEILPDLKRQGKTLIVISHDDRYFDVADRCIRLQAGHIAEETRHRARPAPMLQVAGGDAT
jgi:putative pyoverdin transport system ATP-binding/permease protein